MSTNRRTLIIACGALAHELSEVISVNNLEHIDVECLPASYHNSPEKIPDALEERILKTSIIKIKNRTLYMLSFFFNQVKNSRKNTLHIIIFLEIIKQNNQFLN